ncbi:hypothetical protein O181_014061 [Austropuccinia psidii MF-1]|uniref:Uncharacterized protein n=1 Tax=Austropuccinia psidii MF-1 TaxID=1389203 RepID=A0A9Q3BXH5_9BASI|nr:hypothetical protein [Austropuccinia psidii MF-1]
MLSVHLRSLGIPRNQPEDREGFSRTRRPGRGHLGQSGIWQDTEVQPSIPLCRTWGKLPEDMSQRDILQRPYGNHQMMESHQEFQTPGGEGNQDNGESSHYPRYGRTAEPDRAYSDSFTVSQGVDQPKSPVASHHSGTSRSVAKSHHYSQSQVVSRRRQRYRGKNKTSFSQSKKESYPMIQKRNINPTQNEDSVVTPENNLNSDALWLQMSQFSDQTQKRFAELQESHERIKTLMASMDKIVKTLQEGHAQLIKASEETNKRLNQVFEEEHHCKRDRDFLNQDINKFFNV